MKIERLGQDKIKIFLTFDDLSEWGLQKEDMWKELPKVNELFSEMMDQAYSELGFDVTGPLAVEVFALPAQGMVVIVTRTHLDQEKYEDDEYDEFVEMEVTMEESEDITYAFSDFEDLLAAAKMLRPYYADGGSVYYYNDRWVLQLEPVEMEEARYQAVIAVLSEYGEATAITRLVLEEYGKTVVEKNAIQVLCSHFK